MWMSRRFDAIDLRRSGEKSAEEWVEEGRKRKGCISREREIFWVLIAVIKSTNLPYPSVEISNHCCPLNYPYPLCEAWRLLWISFLKCYAFNWIFIHDVLKFSTNLCIYFVLQGFQKDTDPLPFVTVHIFLHLQFHFRNRYITIAGLRCFQSILNMNFF